MSADARETVAQMMRRTGYTIAEIGQALGVSRTTAKRLLNPQQRESERAYAHRHSSPTAPQALRIEAVLLASSVPLGPSRIRLVLAASGHPTTRASVSVTLDRLKHAGRARNLGYGRWVASRADCSVVGAQLGAPGSAGSPRSSR